MAGPQEIEKRQEPAQGRVDGEHEAAHVSAGVWDEMRTAKSLALEKQISPELRGAADKFVAGLNRSTSDEQASAAFSDFAKQNKSHNSFTLAIALNDAMDRSGAAWHADGDNQGNLSLYRNQPDRDNKVLVESQFFKPGEDIDAAFKPDKRELARLAGNFAETNPDRLDSPDLAKEVTDVISDMKRAGSGPSHAKHALNDALEAANQNLRVQINTHGEVEVEQYYRNKPVAAVDMLCM
jgi:hypothetical protein